MLEIRNCKYCGKEFSVKWHSDIKQYCNKTCAITWRNINVPFTEERKNNISKSLIGRTAWNVGIPRTEEEKKKMSLNHADVRGSKNPNWGKGLKGETNPAWCGGISKERHKNSEKYRRWLGEIRKRDGDMCIICGATKNGKELATHHINYIKKDNRLENIVTLCQSCHSKTNYNREKWIIYFKEKLCQPSA